MYQSLGLQQCRTICKAMAVALGEAVWWQLVASGGLQLQHYSFRQLCSRF